MNTYILKHINGATLERSTSLDYIKASIKYYYLKWYKLEDLKIYKVGA